MTKSAPHEPAPAVTLRYIGAAGPESGAPDDSA